MNEKEKRMALLEREPVNGALLKLGIPTMIGMQVSALYNIVDAFFVGRLGTLQTAAVSVVYPVTMIGLGIGLLFGSGAGSYVSRLLGKKEYEKVSSCTATALVSGVLVMAVTAALMLLAFNPLMEMLGVTAGCLPYAEEYGKLYIFGLIFNVFNIMMNNLMVAEGATAFSMTAMLLGGGANLILDPILIFGFSMGVKGAALATLISRLVSCVFYAAYLMRGKSYLKISLRCFRPEQSLYREIFKIGLPVCFFQFLAGAAVSLTNVMARPFGETAIAAMGIVNRLMSLESNTLFGFLKGYSPLVGFNYGAGKRERVECATRTALCWSTIGTVFFGLVCIVFSRNLIYLFNRESAQVLQIGRMALTVDAVSSMMLGIQIVIGNYFLSVGKAKEGGILSICRQGLLFIPLLICFTRIWGIPGLIFSQLAADAGATCITLCLWRREKKLVQTAVPV